MDIVLGLDTIKELLSRLGNPEKKLNVIHVAGTNGKGSTIAMLSTVLVKSGYKVVKYTSPAVFEQTEMYQIDNKNIETSHYQMIMNIVMEAARSMKKDGFSHPTKFEIDTAIAFVYMAECKCDIAIIETGMGGDLDATNVCDKVLASVITSVSVDHTAFLGDTLEEIASHKAGIIKSRCPVVVSYQSEEVINIVKTRAQELGAQCIVAPESVQNILMEDGSLKPVELSLKGSYQKDNAALVVAVVETLRGQGYNISADNLLSGLSETKWPGRFETISNDPLMVIDGAHNPGAVSQLKKTLEEMYSHHRKVFIIGVLADKDYNAEIEMIADMAETIITVTPPSERALDGKKLADSINANVEINVKAADSIERAVIDAIDEYKSMEGDRLILAWGSLSYMASIKKVMERYADR